MVCQICGKSSGFYPLCIDCNKLKDNGTITKCESCGKWKKDNKPLCYDCWSKENKYTNKEGSFNKVSLNTECEVCGDNSYGKPLCRNCYDMSKEGLLTQCETCGKWKEDDKPLCYDCWLKSKNIKTNIKTAIKDKPQIKYTQQNFREKFKEGLKVRTKHGLLVRSRIERTIAEFLTDNGIIVQYEPTLILEGRELHPDFFIQAIGVYLEHWGSDEPEYKEVRRKKEEVYKKYNVKYISTEESDVDNIYDKLKIELSRYGINKTEWR
ncbi:MAG: hypothetical protein KKD46_06495 [Euryarchaeota archaeon]|nr:hypothetical protein [Euryarchaeota archaeon]